VRSWAAALAGLGSFLTANLFTASYSLDQVYRLEEPTRPPYTASIVAPGWHEPSEHLEVSLSSLKRQTVVQKYPELFEFIFVGCEGVDLSIPAKLGYRVLCAPRGKLRARHLGICSARGEVVVAVDCDTYYPPNWLNLMLRPYRSRDVVGTTTTTWQGGLELFTALLKQLEYSQRMSGRGSTFLRQAYFAVGGFNLDADRVWLETRDIRLLLYEEEVNFKSRLERLGRVVLVNAPVIHLAKTGAGRGLRA
jgi:glycosyltransferase involved in cell wall biosynthesis